MTGVEYKSLINGAECLVCIRNSKENVQVGKGILTTLGFDPIPKRRK